MLTVRVLRTDVATVTDNVGNRMQPITRAIVLHVVAVRELRRPINVRTINLDVDNIITRNLAGKLTCKIPLRTVRLRCTVVNTL